MFEMVSLNMKHPLSPSPVPDTGARDKERHGCETGEEVIIGRFLSRLPVLSWKPRPEVRIRHVVPRDV